jgi:hypothetical protein
VISDTRDLNGRVVEATADNALATVTIAAVAGVRHFVTGIYVSFSAAATAAYKTLQLKYGTTVIANFTFDPLKESLSCRIPFPNAVHGDYNQAVSVELSASGTGGVVGQLKVFTFSQ